MRAARAVTRAGKFTYGNTAITRAAPDMFDLLQLIAYLGAFWLFIFSPSFRAKWLAEFRAAGTGGRVMHLLEGAVAALCGLAPLAVAGWLATS
jgi:hypothetical protein